LRLDLCLVIDLLPLRVKTAEAVTGAWDCYRPVWIIPVAEIYRPFNQSDWAPGP
jgi:hypothetical protein